MTTFTALRRFATGASLAFAALLTLPDPAQATEEVRSYCFYDSDSINVFVGDLSKGFRAYPAGRPGKALYYQRVANTARFVGETGAIYTFFENGDVTWQDGSRTIKLYRC